MYPQSALMFEVINDGDYIRAGAHVEGVASFIDSDGDLCVAVRVIDDADCRFRPEQAPEGTRKRAEARGWWGVVVMTCGLRPLTRAAKFITQQPTHRRPRGETPRLSHAI